MRRLVGLAAAGMLTLFLSGAMAGPTPDGPWRKPSWTALRLSQTYPTSYHVLATVEGEVLRAESRAAASGLVAKAPPSAAPVSLSWRWRVERCTDNGRERAREGDDFPARVFVLFGEGEGGSDPFGWFMRALGDNPFGDLRPDGALNYIWASRPPEGATFESPVGARVRMQVLRSGCGAGEGWRQETRTLAADYEQAFGTDMPEVLGVAVMTDTDDTRGHAVAWYAGVRWSTVAGDAVPVPF